MVDGELEQDLPSAEIGDAVDEFVVDEETYKVGDFVYINNRDSPDLPMIVQIFQIWKDSQRFVPFM
jgi:hypothetical protein